MKTLVPILTAAAVSLLGTTPSRAQDSNIAAAQSTIRAAMEKAQAEAQKAREQMEQQLDQLREQMEKTKQKLKQSGISGTWTGPGLGLSYGLRLPSSPGRVLVITSGNMDAKSVAEMEEDLAVMSRVLKNAIRPESGEQGQRRHAMGIEVFTGLPSNPLQGLYLGDYGALFMLNVDFPLVAPPAHTEEKSEQPPGDSSWDEARRELYGQPDQGRTSVHAFPQYSAEKVSQLKNSLLEALKSATNIRGLKPDDWITVCVFGNASGAQPGPLVHVTRHSANVVISSGEKKAGPGPVLPELGEPPAEPSGSTLSIRVKKSNVDAYAAGKLNLEEFRSRATLSTYVGNSRGARGRATVDAFSVY